MNLHCRAFRARLADALRGRATPPRLSELSWHEHLLSCDDCRAVLSAEEALDALLVSLPEPNLPAELTRRVLSRLEPARPERVGATSRQDLDALLELTTIDAPPRDLARHVLEGLAVSRADAQAAPRRVARTADAQLDHLLERVPAPQTPAALSQRLLLRLAAKRALPEPRKVASLAASGSRWHQRTLVRLAAAVVIAGGAGWGLWQVLSPKPARNDADNFVDSTKDTPPNNTPQDSGAHDRSAQSVAPPNATPDSLVPKTMRTADDELLARLDLLESWDLLSDDDLDVLLSSLDPVDEVLLEYKADATSNSNDAAAPAEPPSTAPTTPPTKQG
jgi:hypothetical protein